MQNLFIMMDITTILAVTKTCFQTVHRFLPAIVYSIMLERNDAID